MRDGREMGDVSRKSGDGDSYVGDEVTSLKLLKRDPSRRLLQNQREMNDVSGEKRWRATALSRRSLTKAEVQDAGARNQTPGEREASWSAVGEGLGGHTALGDGETSRL